MTLYDLAGHSRTLRAWRQSGHGRATDTPRQPAAARHPVWWRGQARPAHRPRRVTNQPLPLRQRQIRPPYRQQDGRPHRARARTPRRLAIHTAPPIPAAAPATRRRMHLPEHLARPKSGRYTRPPHTSANAAKINVITLLDTGSLLNPLPQQHRTASNHRACLMLDEYNNEVKAHIKAFPGNSTALANELAGWILHRAAGIEVAERIWVIILSTAELQMLFPAVDWGDTAEWPCLAVQHINGLPVSARSAELWTEQLAVWHSTAACIAIAEWLWEIDGNAGNLINTGRGEFAAIDFADSFGGPDWTPDTLSDNIHAPFFNKRLHIAWGGLATPSQRQAARECAARHADILQIHWQNIAHWWGCLLKQKQIQAAHHFLKARAVPNWIDNRL